MNVLALSLYGPQAASHRYRLGQFQQPLHAQGIDLEIHSLLTDRYLIRKFAGQSVPWGELLASAASRLTELLTITRRPYDLMIVYAELFPYMPGLVERTLLKTPYIYDFDDAFFLKYNRSGLPFLRPLLGSKFEAIISGARGVSAGNEYLSHFARQYCQDVVCCPTVVSTERYVPIEKRESESFTVGWIGSPSTAAYLQEIVEPLSMLGAEGPVKFIVIGGAAPAVPNVEVIELPWQLDTEVSLINQFEVGIMPIPDTDWARGKCAFKLIQCMACQVPVIGSAVGANLDVLQQGGGFAVKSTQEWLQALRQLRDMPEERKRIGQQARENIVENYSLEPAVQRLSELLRRAAIAV